MPLCARACAYTHTHTHTYTHTYTRAHTSSATSLCKLHTPHNLQARPNRTRMDTPCVCVCLTFSQCLSSHAAEQNSPDTDLSTVSGGGASAMGLQQVTHRRSSDPTLKACWYSYTGTPWRSNPAHTYTHTDTHVHRSAQSKMMRAHTHTHTHTHRQTKKTPHAKLVSWHTYTHTRAREGVNVHGHFLWCLYVCDTTRTCCVVCVGPICQQYVLSGSTVGPNMYCAPLSTGWQGW